MGHPRRNRQQWHAAPILESGVMGRAERPRATQAAADVNTQARRFDALVASCVFDGEISRRHGHLADAVYAG